MPDWSFYLIHCEICRNKFTGAGSKGRHGDYFYYYRCNGDKQNHSAKKAHPQMEEIVKALSFSKRFIKKLQVELEKIIENFWGARLRYLETKSMEVTKKIEELEEKYIKKGTITDATYDKWYRKYQLQLVFFGEIKEKAITVSKSHF